MKNRYITIFLVLAVLTIIAAGCNSTPYTPPPAGQPRANAVIINNCNFSIYVSLDDMDGGYIEKGQAKTYEVSPGAHSFHFSGTDEHFSTATDYPVYMETYHTFADGENFELPVKFGIN